MIKQKLKFNIDKIRYKFAIQSLHADNKLSSTMLEQSSEQWIDYKRKHSEFLIEGPQSRLYKKCEINITPINPQDHSLFILFHHGFYFSYPFYFTKKLGYTGASFIMMQNSIDFSHIQHCANLLDMTCESIIMDSAGLFIRQVIKAKRKGHCIFILVDLPAGFESNNYLYHNAEFGKVKYRSGYFKIAKILKQTPLMVKAVTAKSFKKIDITLEPVHSPEQVISTFCELILKDFQFFERIHELPKMCNFKYEPNLVSMFDIDGNTYEYDAKLDKLYQLGQH